MGIFTGPSALAEASASTAHSAHPPTTVAACPSPAARPRAGSSEARRGGGQKEGDEGRGAARPLRQRRGDRFLFNSPHPLYPARNRWKRWALIGLCGGRRWKGKWCRRSARASSSSSAFTRLTPAPTPTTCNEPTSDLSLLILGTRSLSKGGFPPESGE